MTSSLPWIADALAEREARGLRRGRRWVMPLPGGRCRLDGQELIDFSANDYLDLAGNSRMTAAAWQAMAECGSGARASALVSGQTSWHLQLERRIAAFEGEGDALLFPNGYGANVGTLTALIQPTDVVFCDRFNHASLVDGCRLSGATMRVFRHDRLDKLERELKKSSGEQRRWIVTDGVFSMDGDVAPLPDLCTLAEQFDAAVIVDEAHGTGVFGDSGRGVCEHFHVEGRVAVRIGTLSKAVGCLGGFVAGPCDLVDWLWNTARPQIFSTALPPGVCAAATAAFDIMTDEPARRSQLHQLADRLRTRLRENGCDVPSGCIAPIIPVIIGEPERAVEISRRLQERGFLVPAIRPPTVPNRTSRLRISLTCAHSDDDIDQLAAAIAAEMRSDD